MKLGEGTFLTREPTIEAISNINCILIQKVRIMHSHPYWQMKANPLPCKFFWNNPQESEAHL